VADIPVFHGASPLEVQGFSHVLPMSRQHAQAATIFEAARGFFV
jgi:hypothetical protein